MENNLCVDKYIGTIYFDETCVTITSTNRQYFLELEQLINQYINGDD